MNPQDPLAALRPLHLPDAVSWWPPAPGWWVLALLVLTLAVWLGRWALKRYRHNAYRRAALAELEALRSAQTALFAQHANVLLRRVAIQAFPQTEVRRLSGGEWLGFLDEHLKQPMFASALGEDLLQAAYADQHKYDTEALYQACARWIRQHR